MWWVWIFPLIGIGLLVGAVYAFISAQQFKASALSTIGTVVDYNEHYSRNDNGSSTLMFAPVISYEVDGREYRQTSSVSSSHREYKLGQRIKLLYPADKPEAMQIDNPMHVYMVPGILTFMGVIFCIVGFICVAVFAGPRPELVDTPPEQLLEYGEPRD
jgi:hypothetical protein